MMDTFRQGKEEDIFLHIERRIEEISGRLIEARLARMELQGRLDQTTAEMLKLEGALEMARSLARKG